MKANIIILQETHFLRDDISRVATRWPGQVFSPSFTSHARGVMVLIHKSIPFQLKSQYINPSGRYIILNGTIVSTVINFLSQPLYFNIILSRTVHNQWGFQLCT